MKSVIIFIRRLFAFIGKLFFALFVFIIWLFHFLKKGETGQRYWVEGVVSSRQRAVSVGRLKVVVLDRTDSGQGMVGIAQTKTDENGWFEVSFRLEADRLHGANRLALQVGVATGTRLIALSEIRFNPFKNTLREVLNVNVPETSSANLPSEYESLLSDLARYHPGWLGGLTHPEITYLANKSGWDARLIALAALADQFNEGTKEGNDPHSIEAPFFYALFRAKASTNKSILYRTDINTVESVWGKAIEQGIIKSPESPEQPISTAKANFLELAKREILLVKQLPLVGVSSMRDLLELSLGTGQEDKYLEFVTIYLGLNTEYGGDWARLWTAVENHPELKDTAKRMQIDGKLAYLTINNAPLIEKIHGDDGLNDPIKLVEKDLYLSDEWGKIINGKNGLNDDQIPAEITGSDIDERRARYSETLGAQVRLSYPTMVLGRMVEKGDTVVDSGLQVKVHTFLEAHQAAFQIGSQPIGQYVQSLATGKPDAPVVREIEKLQRVYQITPSDEAMNELLKANIGSAYQVVQYDKTRFVETFKDRLGGEMAARLTYAKAEEVHNAVLNIALAYQTAALAPSMGSVAAAPILAAQANRSALADSVMAFPTMEDIFGELDYCACDHCRSILSPAAYLVDLLKFCEPPLTGRKPLDELLARRPDIENLPLTCENTNTPLPHIDLVNETLEYFVFHSQNIAGYIGHDTDGTATSEELLANPQFGVTQASVRAYAKLAGEHFPPPLPFHQPLENLRRYFDKFETPLPEIMEVLRKDDRLERGISEYGWRDILMEELRLSRPEHRILTNQNPAFTLQELYGFGASTSEQDVVDKLSKAKDYSRRVGITYVELIEILGTRFINPNSVLIPKVEKLGVHINRLKVLHSATETGNDWLALLPQPVPDAAQFGGNIESWVKNRVNYLNIMGLIVLTDTEADPDALKDVCSFDKLKFRYSDPDKITTPIYPFEFYRLIRFIRLWKKLGWSIEQTDKAITALYPLSLVPSGTDLAVNLQRLDAGFLILLPRLGQIKRVMASLNLNANRDLLPLLACFAPIDTQGAMSLYRQMFLSPALLKLDAIFADDGYGNFLENVTVTAHYSHPQSTLEQPILDATPHQLGYDHARELLSYDGILSAIIRDALKAVPGVTPAFQTAVDALYAARLVSPNVTVTARYRHPQSTLEQPILDATPHQIGYDHTRELLSYDGILSAIIRDALKAVPGVTPAFQTAVDALYAARLVSHAEALRAAFGLTGEEFTFIVAALNFDGNTPISLDNISAVFRRGWLAKKLRLSVREFLLLTQTTGIDPFAALEMPEPPVLRLIKLLNRLRAASLKPAQALYLIWNQDISGKSVPDKGEILGFARTLRSSLDAIEKDFAITEDPDGSLARARMAMVYGSETTDFFFGLLDNTLVTETSYNRSQVDLVTKFTYEHSQATLEQAILDVPPKLIRYDHANTELTITGAFTADYREALKKVTIVTAVFKNAVDKLFEENQKVIKANLAQAIVDAAPGRIAYDAFRRRLTFYGVLTEEIRDNLKSAGDGDFDLAVGRLDEEKRKVVDPFFAHYPELKQRYNEYVVPSIEAVEQKRTRLLAKLLQELIPRRKRQQALQAISAAASTDAGFAGALLDNKIDTIYVLHATDDIPRPALDDLTALETLDTGTPADAISGSWSGYLEAPENGFFNFLIEDDAVTAATLTLEGIPYSFTLVGNVWTNSVPIELRAGTLYAFLLTAQMITTTFTVRWETNGRGREVIPSRYLYSLARMDKLHDSYIRFLKVASLTSSLKLSTNEMVHFATHTDYRINAQGELATGGQGWLNALPDADNLHLTNPVDAAIARVLNATLLTPLVALLDFARIKAELSPGDERLLQVLKDPAAIIQNQATSAAAPELLLISLTRWEPGSLDALLNQFGGNAGRLALKNLRTFERVYTAFAYVKKVGISAQALIRTATNEPTADTVRNLQSALRARYGESDWLSVLKPINDGMRRLQRDALVAYILHTFRSDAVRRLIDTPEKLFEYFLMDVQMEPCMQTSRILHAISSVQLFIERCLMNLERNVASSSIDAKQWAWMKRYRIWEANRKVFLYPENWLEPELRDDQSPFFKETIGELLQGDITEDRAATALVNYLSKLEEVSKLEPCGIHYVENDPAKAEDDIAHVVARTAGANRKYYYRRREPSGWTPWEQVKLDIEDNPVIPVVWRSRTFLFWLRIIKQSPLQQPDQPTAGEKLADILASTIIRPDAAKMTVQAILCWSEYYNGKWQQIKTSDVSNPTTIGELDIAIASVLDRNSISLWALEWGNGLRIFINTDEENSKNRPAYFRSYFKMNNTHSLPISREDDRSDQTPPIQYSKYSKSEFKISSDGFEVGYVNSSDRRVDRKVLKVKNPTMCRVTKPKHFLAQPWTAPFFFEDSHHVFYVTYPKGLTGVPYSKWEPYVIAPMLPMQWTITAVYQPVTGGNVTRTMDGGDPVDYNGSSIDLDGTTEWFENLGSLYQENI